MPRTAFSRSRRPHRLVVDAALREPAEGDRRAAHEAEAHRLRVVQRCNGRRAA